LRQSKVALFSVAITIASGCGSKILHGGSTTKVKVNRPSPVIYGSEDVESEDAESESDTGATTNVETTQAAETEEATRATEARETDGLPCTDEPFTWQSGISENSGRSAVINLNGKGGSTNIELLASQYPNLQALCISYSSTDKSILVSTDSQLAHLNIVGSGNKNGVNIKILAGGNSGKISLTLSGGQNTVAITGPGTIDCKSLTSSADADSRVTCSQTK
jgi:hypothetical protein